jgi:hypothetical protein
LVYKFKGLINKHKNMGNNLTDIVEMVSNKTFYEMEKYSQLVIDLVEDIENSDLDNKEVIGSLIYNIDNVLDIINPNKIDDIKVLLELKIALRSK